VPVLGSLISGGCRRWLSDPRDYFAELGVGEFINAGEPYTAVCGALLPPDAVQAMEYAASRYVRLTELHDAIGKRIASLVGCEAAMVTAGAASALTLGTAACITGENRDWVRQLPDVTGLKDEVIIQKAHRYGYDQAVRNCGVRFVEVETAEELKAAINPRTAMMLFNNTADPDGRIKVAEFAALGKKHGVPTLDDCAADVPPASHLSDYLKLGFDLVAVSGGTGIRGPQNAGLLLGRSDLIRAARLNGPPNSTAIGRGMKVSKETMLGMLAALEVFLERDEKADWAEWERRVNFIAGELADLPSIKTEMFAPPLHYHVPHLRLRWDEQTLQISPRDVIRQLREGKPSIEVRSSPPDAVELGVWMLRIDEAEIVARRLREILQAHV
jgi:L-seryl-tRNA(Ser) seleniumtransferase